MCKVGDDLSYRLSGVAAPPANPYAAARQKLGACRDRNEEGAPSTVHEHLVAPILRNEDRPVANRLGQATTAHAQRIASSRHGWTS